MIRTDRGQVNLKRKKDTKQQRVQKYAQSQEEKQSNKEGEREYSIKTGRGGIQRGLRHRHRAGRRKATVTLASVAPRVGASPISQTVMVLTPC